MKKHILAILLMCGLAQWTHAETRDWTSHLPEEKTNVFQESEVELPDLPDTQSGNWFDLYVDEMYTGKPRILLDSVSIAPDGSVRYVLNQRSAKGYDNVTAEGLRCLTGQEFFNSEGAHVKIFGYGDLSNQRWIEPRKSQWTVIGGKLNNTDKVRGTLYQLFCIEGLPKTDDELRKRISLHGGRTDRSKNDGNNRGID